MLEYIKSSYLFQRNVCYYFLRILLIQTYELQDCDFYNDCTTSSIENHWNVPSTIKNSTYGFSSNGWTYGNVSSFTRFASIITLPDFPYEISFQIKNIQNVGFQIEVANNNNIYVATRNTGTQIYLVDGSNVTVDYSHTYKLKVYSNKVEFYDNDNLVSTKSVTVSSKQLQLATGSNRECTIKDIKVKAL